MSQVINWEYDRAWRSWKDQRELKDLDLGQLLNHRGWTDAGEEWEALKTDLETPGSALWGSRAWNERQVWGWFKLNEELLLIQCHSVVRPFPQKSQTISSQTQP